MNNRLIYIFVAVLALAWSMATSAALVELESGYELGISELTLPAHTAGQVVISGCAECESSVHSVNGQTEYYIGNSPVELDDLRAAVAGQVGTFIYVAYSLDTGFVTRITLTPGE